MKIFKLFIDENIKTWKKLSTKIMIIAIILSLFAVLALVKFMEKTEENLLVYNSDNSAGENEKEFLEREIEFYESQLKNEKLDEETRLVTERNLEMYKLYLEYDISPYNNTWENELVDYIVEQKIGQGREDCDARWERILSRFSRNSLRTVCLELDGIEMAVPGRLKTAGCRVTSDADWEIPEFDALLFSRVFVHSLTEAGRAERSFESAFRSCKAWLRAMSDVVRDRANEIGKVWMPNPAANSAIMARLLQTSLSSTLSA